MSATLWAVAPWVAISLVLWAVLAPGIAFALGRRSGKW